MARPDQVRFDQFSAHFETIDAELEQFCADHALELQKNLHRQPCRVLRRRANPELVIGFYLNGHWLKIDHREDMPHSVGVAAYYHPPEGKRFVRRASIIDDAPFSVIQFRLTQVLTRCLDMLESWPSPVMLDDEQALREGWERTRA